MMPDTSDSAVSDRPTLRWRSAWRESGDGFAQAAVAVVQQRNV